MIGDAFDVMAMAVLLRNKSFTPSDGNELVFTSERNRKAVEDHIIYFVHYYQAREKINQQLSMLQEFQKQNAPISETVKLVSLENTAQSIKHETVLEERDQETGEIIEYRKLFSLKI